MRTYGRIANTGQWYTVTTDANGFSDAVRLTQLAQVLLLGLGESPLYGNVGIPAQQSVLTQIPPDYYVQLVQQQFSQYFASLIIVRVPSAYPGSPPTYNISVVTNQGAQLTYSTGVPI